MSLLAKPVIQRLNELNILPEQSLAYGGVRGPLFFSLPLHAVGPIRSDVGSLLRYFLNLYIPS